MFKKLAVVKGIK